MIAKLYKAKIVHPCISRDLPEKNICYFAMHTGTDELKTAKRLLVAFIHVGICFCFFLLSLVSYIATFHWTVTYGYPYVTHNGVSSYLLRRDILIKGSM